MSLVSPSVKDHLIKQIVPVPLSMQQLLVQGKTYSTLTQENSITTSQHSRPRAALLGFCRELVCGPVYQLTATVHRVSRRSISITHKLNGISNTLGFCINDHFLLPSQCHNGSRILQWLCGLPCPLASKQHTT